MLEEVEAPVSSTVAVDGKHRVSQAAEILGVYQSMDCDIGSLHETRRSGQSAFLKLCL